MFIDARSVPRGTSIEADICIVGAGAAGLTLARELIGSQLKVCLLEAGGLAYEADTQDLYRGESVGFSYFPLEATRLRMFGGTTMHWGGACRPLDPIDFHQREWVPHSGWPFDFAHLVPFYRRAQRVLQTGPFEYTGKAWEREGLYAARFDAETLRNEVIQQSPPTRFGFEYRDEVERARNIDTYLHANVLEIATNESGKRVTRLRVASLERNEFFVSPKITILAAGGIETTRLLLQSDRTNPRGVGNSNGLVGRFFMEHPIAGWGLGGAIAPIALPLKFYHDRVRGMMMRGNKAATATLWGFVTPSERTLREKKLLNYGVALRPTPTEEAPGIVSARGIRDAVVAGQWPDDFATHISNVLVDFPDVTLHSVKKLTGWESVPDVVETMYWAEPQPNPDSRIYLSRERDALGQRRAVVDWRLTEHDTLNMQRAMNMLATELGRAGIGRLRIDPKVEAGDAPQLFVGSYHHMGTTRMHTDRRQGVVDANCRLHEVSNLYVASSSVFPTAGHANPTLTIVAMALRLADHVKGLMT